MRPRFRWCAALLALAMVAAPAFGQEAMIGGFLELDRRLGVSDSVTLADFYGRFRPELRVALDRGSDMVVSLDLRFHDFSRAESPDDLEDPGAHFPTTLAVWEAFVRVPGFLVEPLDVTIGKQRIPWGTADGLNPTDRFNAYDLSDLTDFTARVPTWAARLEYYVPGDWRLEAVWSPTAHGPLLPTGSRALFSPAAMPPAPLPIASWTQHFVPPPPRLANSQYGVRLSGGLGGLDVSASFFAGFDGLPIVERLVLEAAAEPGAAGMLDAHLWNTLPRSRALGADFAGEWHGAGLWGEAGLVFPSQVQVTPRMPDSADNAEPWVVLDDDPYATWTLGGDYAFRGGYYLNLQWAHGLFFERGAGQMHDYLVGRLERRLLRDALGLALEGALEVGDRAHPSHHLGYGLFPSVEYSPVDNVLFSVGAFLVDGRGTSTFRRWGEADQVYFRVRGSF